MNKYLKEFLENFKDYVVFDYDAEKELAIQDILKEGTNSFKLFPNRVIEKVIDKITNASKKQRLPILMYYSCSKNSSAFTTSISHPFKILYIADIVLSVSDLGISVEKIRQRKGLALKINDYFKFPSNAEDFILNI